MKKLLIVTLCASFLMISSLAVAGIVPILTFEDLYAGFDDVNPLPIDYQGFTWDTNGSFDAYYITKAYVPASGIEYGIFGNVGMLTGFAATASMKNTTLFDFNGAYITAAYDASFGESNPQTLQVQGWVGANAVYSQTLNFSDMLPLWVDFNFLNVDQVTFTPLNGSAQFLVDNINNNAAVPVPPAVFLLGSGLVALVGLRRFRRN
ncbi:MAG: hypothetical protein WC443_10740 [Desulfobaccales bacterium]